MGAGLLVAHLNLMLDNIEILVSLLLNKPYLFNLLCKHNRRPVENREFGSVQFDKTVVNASCIERRKGMFDGGDSYIAT